MEEQTTQTVEQGSAGRKWIVRGVIGLLVSGLVIGGYGLGYAQGKSGFVFDPTTFKVINQKDQPVTVDYALLWDAIAKLKANHIDKPANDQKILYGAVKGAVESVGDPYTEFFTPEELESFKTDLSGSFDGIGAEIGKDDGNIVIIAPLDASPAKAAGLLPKDVIVKVDGAETTGWSVEETVRRIRGKKGTTVVLTIYRQGRSDTFDVSIKRDQIIVKSVKWEVKTASGTRDQKKIGYISVSRFGEDTESLFSTAVQELRAQNVVGIVLDLRSDPGGYLDTAVELGSYWIPKGKLVVKEALSGGKDNDYNSKGYARLSDLPTVTLINGGSASASEILAGALHDYKLTTLVGEKSYGKGSVQTILSLAGGSGLKVTVAKWITPNGKNISKEGIAPDVEVKLTEEDVQNKKDPQLDRALQEFTK
ncbi:MAG: S41 family peptidase [Candidatus Doudnabacteria bacterium]|nr:S41 family peptidase [Candidatus Doudnabacteria bacterium]